MSSRLRPLHTCGASFLAIVHSTCSRAQNLDGRLGSTTRKMARITKLVNPLVFVLQYQWLLFLSLIDDGLLAMANIVEKIFPPSKLVFDRIDELLHLIETLPRKFDDAVDKLPCFNQVLFLEWAVTHAISLLKFMITILMNWGRDGTREKEILVDMNYNEGRNGSKSADKTESCTEGTISSVSETKQAAMDEKMKSDAMNGTHKEVLKMGTKGEEDDEDGKENEKGTYKRAMEEEGTKAMEDKEKLRIGQQGSTKKVEDGESCEKDDENNESQRAEMEGSVEKAKGIEEIPDQSHEYEENSEGKDENSEAGLMDHEYEEEASNGSIENEEDILELFETAWLMKPTRNGKGNLMPRSASVV